MPNYVLIHLAKAYLVIYFLFCVFVAYQAFRSLARRIISSRHVQSKIYERLHPGYIRLLVVHPGKPEAVLEGHLVKTTIGGTYSNINYEALSYVWGKSFWRKSMVVNGERISITRNLYDALKHLRHPNENRLIWVDAICIDQTNKEERNTQVLKMGDVYKSAEQVVNWLGPATSKTALGMKALAFLFGDENITFAPPWTSYPAKQLRGAFNDILKRDYFERIWVVQENALASKITLQAGNHTLTWLSGAQTHRAICRIKFAAISPSWESAGLQDVDFRPLLEILEQNKMMTRMNMKRPCRDVTILDLAYDMRYRKSTDRRDMLFALRNMIPEDMKESFVVDYSKSADELYGEFFREYERAYEEEMKFVEGAENERLENERLVQARYRRRAGW